MAKRSDRKSRPPPPALSQPNFSTPAVNYPPPSWPIAHPSSSANSSTNIKEKDKAKATNQSSPNVPEYPHPPYPLNPPNAQPQAPVVRWVYNYDHTDPLNFGFMFPVTSSSSAEFSTPSSYPTSASVTAVTSAPSDVHTSTYPSSPLKAPPESSTRGNILWSLSPGETRRQDQQLVPSKQMTHAGTSQQQHNFHFQALPHRYSPSPNNSPPVQQPAPSEDQIW